MLIFNGFSNENNNRYFLSDCITKKIYNNPYTYFNNKLTDEDKEYYKEIIQNEKVLKMLIKPTFSQKELEAVSNTKDIFRYMFFLDSFEARYLKETDMSFAQTWYSKRLFEVTKKNTQDFLEIFIKIAKLCDASGCYEYGEGFSNLINVNQVFFINTINKLKFVDEMCSLIDIGANSFKLTKETKEIYKKYFKKNDKTIEKILKCEKDFNIVSAP